MKYIQKQATPQLLADWLSEYDAELQTRYTSTRNIANIWSDDLGKALDRTDLTDEQSAAAKLAQADMKHVLDNALLADQGYICCYCGCRITAANFVREHYLDKSHHRHLVFQYHNLLASCKGGKDAPYRIGQPVLLNNGETITINSPDDVLTVLHQTLPHLTLADLTFIPPLGKGDQIKYPNPVHCDSAKGSQQIVDAHEQLTIVDPIADTDCAYWFSYTQKPNTSIEIEAYPGPKEAVAKNTINILNLNAETLCGHKDRKKAYQTGTEAVTALSSFVYAEPNPDAFVQRYIEDEIYKRDEANQFTPFCQITAAVIRQGTGISFGG